jgi:phospholipid/cholesterol/gamma-HCH transport system ATP-binding protein
VTLEAENISPDIPAIELIDINAGYGDRVILEDIDLSVKRGEIFTVIGLSGSGKSTLLKLVIGFIKPKSGKVLIDGEDISRMSERQLTKRIRPKMGMVFQHAALFDSMNVFENVAFPYYYRGDVPRNKIRELVMKRLEDVDMDGTEKLMPDELSGGMQKRVGLARALAENPSIILYDEPTTGLDPVITNNINKLIQRTRERYKATSLLISHDMESVFKISDRVGVLVDGRMIFIGTPSEVQASQIKEVQAFIHGEEIPSHHHKHSKRW